MIINIFYVHFVHVRVCAWRERKTERQTGKEGLISFTASVVQAFWPPYFPATR